MQSKPCQRAGVGRKVKHEVAEVFRLYGNAFRQNAKPLPEQRKVMRAVESCRTAALGGHRYKCNSCDHEQNAYNSCRDRHCPKCQSLRKARWVEARQSEVLPVGYYHLVFTLPHTLNPLVLTNKRALLGLLFRAVAETLQAFGERHLHGKIGGTLVLHTWDQKLGDHFHLHCVVPAGALVEENRWQHARGNFLFSVKALSDVFRGKFLAGMRRLRKQGHLQYLGRSQALESDAAFRNLLKSLRAKRWIVYSKAPFSGPKQLLEYLGRYTHRVAISNNRILEVDDGYVNFAYRDRKNGDVQASMRLPAEEFIRRFLLHTLPSGFQRLRHFGFLANRSKRKQLAQCKKLLGAPPREESAAPKLKGEEFILAVTGLDISACPKCAGRLQVVETLIPMRAWRPRGPP